MTINHIRMCSSDKKLSAREASPTSNWPSIYVLHISSVISVKMIIFAITHFRVHNRKEKSLMNEVFVCLTSDKSQKNYNNTPTRISDCRRWSQSRISKTDYFSVLIKQQKSSTKMLWRFLIFHNQHTTEQPTQQQARRRERERNISIRRINFVFIMKGKRMKKNCRGISSWHIHRLCNQLITRVEHFARYCWVWDCWEDFVERSTAQKLEFSVLESKASGRTEIN